ncbi:hypothetical protein CDAR_5851 [Caerostris darwini]|uniref:Uncharacterized protein n=1 Tax=Caerostris darwini TaxID=1538125 RepID=A0AAV4RDH1_9ARAC|nr:hypothetical protein CDAR_5851 [Caerostris darwini]
MLADVLSVLAHTMHATTHHPSSRGGALLPLPPKTNKLLISNSGHIHLGLLQNANHPETNCHYITALLIKAGQSAKIFLADLEETNVAGCSSREVGHLSSQSTRGRAR